MGKPAGSEVMNEIIGHSLQGVRLSLRDSGQNLQGVR